MIEHRRKRAHVATVRRAVRCHASQLPAYSLFEDVGEEQQQMLWGVQTYYRVFGLKNGGRDIEDNLFDGLRQEELSKMSFLRYPGTGSNLVKAHQ
jgi:hypothetical protein